VLGKAHCGNSQHMPSQNSSKDNKQQSDFAELHQRFVNNTMQGRMLDLLADNLGVSIEALIALEVGYLPFIHYPRTKEHDEYTDTSGLWTIPERDHMGRIVGISLRNPIGRKGMYPGSKRGLIFSQSEYNNVRFTRTKPGGYECPICSKQDWGCLVSDDDPQNPSRVICVRVPSDKPMAIGWLHIRRTTTNIEAGNSYQLIVEGASDVMAAYDLGFHNAIGKPSASTSCDKSLQRLIEDKDIVIIGDNDSDKGNVGEIGAEKTKAWAKQFARTVCTIIAPSPELKDLRKWKNEGGLTRERLLQLIAEKGKDAPIPIGVDPEYEKVSRQDKLIHVGKLDWSNVAEVFLKHHYKCNEHRSLYWWKEKWYEYRIAMGKYVEVSNDDIDITTDKYIGKLMQHTQSGATIPVGRSLHNRDELRSALSLKTKLNGDIIPMWADGRESQDTDPTQYMIFNNGMVHIPTYMDGGSYWSPLTPELFNINKMAIDFISDATCPSWHKYLESNIANDTNIRVAQEWAGYCMTNDTRFDKFAILLGPPRSGKGTFINILYDILGDFATIQSLEGMGREFGLTDFPGKYLVAVPEVDSSGKKINMSASVERILSLTGNDRQAVNRKFENLSREHIIKPSIKLMMAMNKVFRGIDNSQAIRSRLLLIPFPHSYVGKEDVDLYNRLRGELSGIALWAMQGLSRLYQQGKFTLPDNSMVMEEWDEETNSVIGFFRECCQFLGDEVVLVNHVADVWRKWGKTVGMTAPIGNALKKMVVEESSDRVQLSTDGESFIGLKIKPEIQRRFGI
jgi:P4 family phage/plasmid primase-like protien